MTLDFFNSSQTADRRAELQKVAQEIGGTFLGTHPLPLLKHFADVFGYNESDSPFDSNDDHPLTGKMSNFFCADLQGQYVAVFDQTYYLPNYEVRRNLGSRFGYTQTFFLIRIKEANFPLFCLQPLRTPDNFTKNIDFPSHPNLSQKFILYSRDEPAVRQLFTLEVLNFFENNIAFTLFAGEKYLLIYQRNGIVSPNQIMASLNFIVNLANLFLKKD